MTLCILSTGSCITFDSKAHLCVLIVTLDSDSTC